MKIALYKGKKTITDKLISWWDRGLYSHVELVFSDGMCASASPRDGGVRMKLIDLDADKWDVFEIHAFDEARARAWFEQRIGQRYDFMGVFGFVFRAQQDKAKWFCSESVLAALGFKDTWRFTPNTVAILFTGGTYQ